MILLVATLVVPGLVIAFVFLTLLRQYIRGGTFKGKERIDGKTVVITGANQGIGKATAIELAKRGGTIIIGDRKCDQATIDDITSASGNKDVSFIKLDLASFAAIRRFAKEVNSTVKCIDILINNAGVLMPNTLRTEDGLEMTLGVNYFGHFLLTHLLLDKLRVSSSARIVHLASVAHKLGAIDFNQLNNGENYGTFKRYIESKMATVLYTREQAKRLKDTNITVNCCHPGVVDTSIAGHFWIQRGLIWKLTRPVYWLFFKRPIDGAQTTLRLTLDSNLEGVSGKYFSDCVEVQPAKQALNDDLARKLWQVSEELTQIKKEQ